MQQRCQHIYIYIYIYISRKQTINNKTSSRRNDDPEEAEYADDTDFLSTDKDFVTNIFPHIEAVFKEYKLIVNADKT